MAASVGAAKARVRITRSTATGGHPAAAAPVTPSPSPGLPVREAVVVVVATRRGSVQPQGECGRVASALFGSRTNSPCAVPAEMQSLQLQFLQLPRHLLIPRAASCRPQNLLLCRGSASIRYPITPHSKAKIESKKLRPHKNWKSFNDPRLMPKYLRFAERTGGLLFDVTRVKSRRPFAFPPACPPIPRSS